MLLNDIQYTAYSDGFCGATPDKYPTTPSGWARLAEKGGGGVKFSIAGAPRTKKNSQQLIRLPSGRRMVKPSEKYEEYERAALLQLKHLRRLLPGPIDCPVNIKCVYYMPTLRRVDLTNLEEATDDILVRAGIIADDNSKIVAGHDGSRVRLDRQLPRVEIEIVRMEE